MATTIKQQKDTGAAQPNPERTDSSRAVDSRIDKCLELMSQTHQTTQEHIKNTQAILGRIVEVNNNLTSIITNNVYNPSQQFVQGATSPVAGELSDAQQRFKNSYPRIRS